MEYCIPNASRRINGIANSRTWSLVFYSSKGVESGCLAIFVF